jgi:hypothetical protein
MPNIARSIVTVTGWLGATAAAGAGEPVRVVLDMDVKTPGIQSRVSVHACQTTVEVAVYVVDPLESRTLWSIGYVGGIDRGIAFGHVPNESENRGEVGGIAAEPGTPVNPRGASWIVAPPGLDPGFAGPEVQYLEFGAETPAVIPGDPVAPIFTAAITLDGARRGDRFDFHLLDFVTVWSGGGHGAFSTQGPEVTLDTGGDAVPDGTRTIYGTDPDEPVPVPPAAFLVNYIDGPPAGGPAVIEIVSAAGDADGDGDADLEDLLAVLSAWGPCADCPEDFDDDGTVDFRDLLDVLNAWGGCPAK